MSGLTGLKALKGQMSRPADVEVETNVPIPPIVLTSPISSGGPVVVQADPTPQKKRKVNSSRKRRELPENSDELPQINVKITPELMLRVKMKLLQENRSMTNLVESLLKAYVERG